MVHWESLEWVEDIYNTLPTGNLKGQRLSDLFIMKTWQAIILGIFIGVFSAGAMLFVVTPPRGKALELSPVSSPSPITIYVTGAVNNPGIYSLPFQSRVADAIKAASGFRSNADQATINLAKRIDDGERIFVPEIDQIPKTTPMNSSGSQKPQKSATLVPVLTTFPININSATSTDLELLPEIGSTRAAQIIIYREKNGPFKRIEDIQNVPGISKGTYSKIMNLISLGEIP